MFFHTLLMLVFKIVESLQFILKHFENSYESFFSEIDLT